MKTLTINEISEASELGADGMAGAKGGIRSWERVLPWEIPVVLPEQPPAPPPENPFPGPGPTFPY